MTSRPKGRIAGRVIRHKLKDGSIKTYTYPPHRRRPPTGAESDTLQALIDAYQRSPEWLQLASITRTTNLIYLRELARVGHVRVSDIRRRDLLAVRDAIAASRGHGAAAGFCRTCGTLFSFALDREWLDASPAARLAKGLHHGHWPAWTQTQADAALERLPSPLAKVVMLALYLGARRSDLVRLQWSAFDGEAITFIPQKTRTRSPDPLRVPCHPVLREALEQWRSGAVTPLPGAPILTTPEGRQWSPHGLSMALARGLKAIGLQAPSLHGLRKLAASNLAEAGCSSREIGAVTGHATLAMIELYTKAASQKRLAEAAIIRLSERGTKEKKG